MGQTPSRLNGTGYQVIQASKGGDADAVMELVSAYPNLLHYSTFHNLGPCHFAARGNHVEVLQQLVAKAEEVEQLQWQAAAAAGYELNTQIAGATTKHATREKRDPVSIKPPCRLVQQLVNAGSDRHVTPLMLAAGNGCTASVKLLLEKGADPWAVDRRGCHTALHYAARTNNPEIPQLLIEAAGSSGPVNFPNRPNTPYVDVRTQDGLTALHIVVASNHQHGMAVLLNMNANPLLASLYDCWGGINCPQGSTALHLAARRGNEAAAQQLLRTYVERWYHRHLPDPRLVLDSAGALPCQVAVRCNHAGAAGLLLPSNPLPSMHAGDVGLLGPPSLAAIVGAVLKATLTGELDKLLQQEQPAEEQQPEEAAQSPESVADVDPDCAEWTSGVTDACVVINSSDSCDDISVDEDQACGVCLDASAQVTLNPCGHQLCLDCCRNLLGLNSRCVMVCPFCRGGVGHLMPVCQPVKPSGAEAAAVQQRLSVAP